MDDDYSYTTFVTFAGRVQLPPEVWDGMVELSLLRRLWNRLLTQISALDPDYAADIGPLQVIEQSTGEMLCSSDQPDMLKRYWTAILRLRKTD